MPIRAIEGTGGEYFLVVLDKDGKEVRERCEGGGRMSDAIYKRVAQSGQQYTDIFFASHGWKGHIRGAIKQYDRWFATMASMAPDIEAVRTNRPDFMPLIIGLHGPSLPWGDESLPETTVCRKSALLGASDSVADAQARDVADANFCASQIADSAVARSAIRTILSFARTAESAALTPAIRDAYAIVFAESGLRVGSVLGRPGSDQSGFDPDAVIEQAAKEFKGKSGDGGEKTGRRLARSTLGEPETVGRVRDAILAPLRQLLEFHTAWHTSKPSLRHCSVMTRGGYPGRFYGRALLNWRTRNTKGKPSLRTSMTVGWWTSGSSES